MVSDSVSKKFWYKKIWYKKKSWIRYLETKKVSDSVSEIFGIEKSIGFGIRKYLVSNKVSDSVSEIFGIKNLIFGIEKLCKKSWFCLF